MALDEFLAWEERRELRNEFDGFAPKAMNGGTGAHSTIQGRGGGLSNTYAQTLTADPDVSIVDVP
jgi:hypothetical protein